MPPIKLRCFASKSGWNIHSNSHFYSHFSLSKNKKNRQLLDNIDDFKIGAGEGNRTLVSLKMCKSQHTTLALDLSPWKIGNPNAEGATKPANDLRWGKRIRVPTSALLLLRRPVFALLLTGLRWPQCASKEVDHPWFWHWLESAFGG